MKSKLILGTILTVSCSMAAAAEFAANVAYTTDYRFRGISQGDRSQAIQGGFDLGFENGFYVGTWASNVTFSGAGIEVDYYAGYSADINDNSAFDIGLLWYNYPEDDADPDLDYYEIYGSYTYRDFTIGLNYSPDYFAETDKFWYVYANYSVGLGENFSLDLHLGANIFDDDTAGAAFGIGEAPSFEDQYLDYSVGVSTSAVGLDLSLAWMGTDLDDDECFGGTKLCEDAAVLTISKEF